MPVWLITLLINLAVAGAKALIDYAVEASKPKPGVKGSMSMGGDVPMSFILGHYGTAGHLEYPPTSWGETGGTPNAYLVQVISLSDLPVTALSQVWINGELVTLGGTPHADYGYPVTEYRVSSKDHLWVNFYDGTQTTADAYLVAKFGTHAERPWTTDMIGRGIAYVIVTSLVNRELWTSPPEGFFVVDGIPNYDPRDEAQALDDAGTWEKSDNPLVQVDNILRGIYYDDEWVYGLQGQGAQQPNSNAAQMDKCDVAVSLAGGGTEPRFRTGAEITVDTPPRDTVLSLLASCNGRIAEIGGSYKVLVGEPDAVVYSFTDEDVTTSEGQSYEPFPGLEATTNGATATYVEPDERWATKDAPARYSTGAGGTDDLEAEDDGRRLPAALSFPYVYSGTQVQRLMKAAVEEARRFRAHSHTMPPEAWEYEPLDAWGWTSSRNGYTDKVMLLTAIEDLPNGNQVVGLKEQDAADYDWTAGTDEAAISLASLAIVRPAAQALQSFTATATWFEDAGAVARIPAITCEWEDDLDDIRGVQLQVRIDGLTVPFLDKEVPYITDAGDPGYVISEGLLPETDYNVRARPLPYSGRATDWTSWADVTTVDTMVPGAKLDLLSVDTPVVADNAITEATTADVGTGYQYSTNSTRYQIEDTILTITKTVPTGYFLALHFSGRYGASQADAASWGNVRVRLKDGSTVLKESLGSWDENGFQAQDTETSFIDKVSGDGASHTITVTMTFMGYGPANGNGNGYYLKMRYAMLLAVLYKK